ncbi:MAG TPA: hypothetical protein PK733_09465, partial [Clostridiales bacterium]|nr:hypothetical protein [Clostridiales bacterium]
MHQDKKYKINTNTGNLKYKDKSIRHIRKKLEYITILFLIVAGLIVLIMSPIFNISNVYIYGNSHYSTEEIS